MKTAIWQKINLYSRSTYLLFSGAFNQISHFQWSLVTKPVIMWLKYETVSKPCLCSKTCDALTQLPWSVSKQTMSESFLVLVKVENQWEFGTFVQIQVSLEPENMVLILRMLSGLKNKHLHNFQQIWISILSNLDWCTEKV